MEPETLLLVQEVVGENIRRRLLWEGLRKRVGVEK
jgi:hypothetical protein